MVKNTNHDLLDLIKEIRIILLYVVYVYEALGYTLERPEEQTRF